MGEVDAYFDPPYKNLTAVKMVGEMIHEQGLAYDAIPEFALHLSPRNFSKAMNWSDMIVYRPYLNASKLDEFASAVAEFANKTDFWRFYNEHRGFYENTLKSFAREHGGDVVNLTRMEEEFFGGENASAWFIDLQLVFARDDFAYYFDNESGKYVYGILGVTSVYNRTPPHYNVEASDFLAHEFAHSFVNPAVDSITTSLSPTRLSTLLFRRNSGLWPTRTPRSCSTRRSLGRSWCTTST